MSLQVIGKTKDLRTNTHVIYAQISISDYLELVGTDFSEFRIQRKREKHQAYERLKSDIKLGTVLPTITLVLKREISREISREIDNLSSEELTERLNIPNQTNILDGLQRTYLIQDLSKEDFNFNPEQKILLEFWIEEKVENIVYRFIVLNAGRKEMSLDHQLELLFMAIQERITEEIEDLEIYVSKDNQRRNRAGQFAFKNIVTSYYCFLTKNYLISKRNLISKQMLEEKIVYASLYELNEQFSDFIKYFKYYVDLDKHTYSKYPERKNWLAQETVMNSFFGAITRFSNNNERKKGRVINALGNLIYSLQNSNTDVWGLENLYTTLGQLDKGRFNIGATTRKLLFNGFREFFRSEGEDLFNEIWEQESNVVLEKTEAI